jgi:hypothetical protein
MTRRRAPGRIALAAAVAAATIAAGCGHAAPAPAATRCPGGVHHGDLRLDSQESVDVLARCTTIDGDLTVATGAALDLGALAGLERVTGRVAIGPTLAIDAIELAGLREAGELVIAGNNSATGAFFPALAHVGRLQIIDNLALASVSLSALAVVDGEVNIARNGDLEALDAMELRRVGGDWVLARNPVLASLLLDPGLIVSGVRTVTDCPSLSPE